MDYNLNDYELFYLINEDNEEALEMVFNKYEPLIKKIAYHYLLMFSNQKLEYEDLIEEGRIGLLKAIRSYNVYENVLFYTYVLLCVKRQILKTIEKSCSNKNYSLNTAVYLDDFLQETITDYKHPLNNIEEHETETNLIKFKNTLDFNDSLIFELRLNKFKYDEIGILLDISSKEVDNSLLKIRRKLKKYLCQM